MIAFIGDVHRSFTHLARLVATLPDVVQAVVQVGDLGLRPEDLEPSHRRVPPIERPILFIAGNHDHDPWYRGLSAPTEVGPNLVYVPRGAVLNLDDRRVAFLGGGDSVIDRPWRREGVDWWPDERVTPEDTARFLNAGPVDILVTHTPPAAVYPHLGFRPDPSSRIIEQVWESLGRPTLVCGHLHRAHAVGRIRVLAELEVFLM